VLFRRLPPWKADAAATKRTLRYAGLPRHPSAARHLGRGDASPQPAIPCR